MSLNREYINRVQFSEYSRDKNKPLLPHMDIELTERCNNNCIHCYINQPENDEFLKEKELSTAELKKIIKQAADLGCLGIRFTGGEPLLRKDFKDIYLFTRRQGIKITLFTNGILIDEELIDLFSKYPPGNHIEITLYGTNERAYEKAAGVKGHFNKAVNGIELLNKNEIPYRIKGLYFEGRKEDDFQVENFLSPDLAIEFKPSYSMHFDLRARRDSIKKNRYIKSLRVTPEKTIKFILSHKNEYIQGLKEFALKFMKPPGDTVFNCGCGQGGSVDSYGKFQPCLMMRHPDFVYDLGMGSLKYALENFFPDLKKIESKNPAFLNKCARCFLNGLCENCPGKSWMEHGVLDSPVDYYCDIAHAKAKFAGLIGDNEFGWEVKDWKERIKKFCLE